MGERINMFTNDSFNGKGFSAESSKQKKWVMPVESFPRYMRTTDNDWAKDFYCDRVWIERKGDEYTLKWIVRAYKPTKVQRPAMKVFSKTYPYTADGWFNGYMRWAQIPMRGKDWQKEVQEKLGSFVGKRAESHAYSYAYNEGHSDSRKKKEYRPNLATPRQEGDFKRILKQKAESFGADANNCQHEFCDTLDFIEGTQDNNTVQVQIMCEKCNSVGKAIQTFEKGATYPFSNDSLVEMEYIKDSFNAEYPKSVSCAWCNREFNPNRDKHFEYNGEFMHNECAKEVVDVTAWEDVAVTPSAKAESFSATQDGKKVYVVSRRCEDYSEYRQLEIFGIFSSLTQARKVMNGLFKKSLKEYNDDQEDKYDKLSIKEAKSHFGWEEWKWGSGVKVSFWQPSYNSMLIEMQPATLNGSIESALDSHFAESFNAEYPKGEKGYVIYSLGYNEGEQGKGRKSPESFVSMIAKFNDIENSYMLSDDDKSYAIYTIGYFDGESDKINKRTPQAFELMLSKMGKSYGNSRLPSIPKTARLDAESFSAENKKPKLTVAQLRMLNELRYQLRATDYPQDTAYIHIKGYGPHPRNQAKHLNALLDKGLINIVGCGNCPQATQSNNYIAPPTPKNCHVRFNVMEAYSISLNPMADEYKYKLPSWAKRAESHDFSQKSAESFAATKGIDTFTEPFEEMGVPKWLIGIGGVVAAITGINYLSKKL